MDIGETVYAVKRSEFLLARALNAGVTDPGRFGLLPLTRFRSLVEKRRIRRRGFFLLRLVRAQRHGNSHRRLDIEYILALASATPLAAEIEYPYLVAKPAHMFAHPAESNAVEITRCTDETDHARTVLVLENLP